MDEHTEIVTFETYRQKLCFYSKVIVEIVNQCRNLKQLVFTKDTQTGLFLHDPPLANWKQYIQDARLQQTDFTEYSAK